MPYSKLVYCASPARLSSRKTDIMDFVLNRGMAPLHPFNALPTEYFENSTVGRTETLEVCCRLVDICDEFWLFGISEGTLIEMSHFFKSSPNKPFKVWIKQFDPEYKTYIKQYHERFGEVMSRLNEFVAVK